jgi:hypothetical protein
MNLTYPDLIWRLYDLERLAEPPPGGVDPYGPAPLTERIGYFE